MSIASREAEKAEKWAAEDEAAALRKLLKKAVKLLNRHKDDKDVKVFVEAVGPCL